MDEIAENGIASHWSYKENGSSVKASMQDEMTQKLQFFKSIIELMQEENDEAEFVNTVQNEVLKNTIYVFTPAGDVIELPKGSTPIDFAYKVHTKVGDKMVGAIVNGNIAPLDYELQDNDIVKINTSNNSAGPSREWINIAKTTSAKNKIKSFFNKIDKNDNLKEGIEQFNKELKKQKIAYNDFFSNEEEILKQNNVTNLDDLFILVGSNKVSAISIINNFYKNNVTKEELILNKTIDKDVKIETSKNEVIVDGAPDIKINIASCCKPIKGDPIVGFITKGYGINVHRTICPNVVNAERIISVSWNEYLNKKYLTTIIVRVDSNKNILLDIISKTSNNDINVQSVININKGNNTAYELTIGVANIDILNKFINDLEMMKDVINVERVIK
jgi:GTP pyrophosphokinase